jgi:hypothetical protein
MVIYCYFLGVHSMADDLKRIAEILKEVRKDLKELNDEYDKREIKNGRFNVLPTSNARTTRNRRKTKGD